MTAFRSAFVLALALVLAGCFQTETTVRLNADGSGTVEERVLMNSTLAMASMMGGMRGQMNLDAAQSLADGPYSEEALEARAEAMGATFEGVETIQILFGSGYVATYAFEEIGQLQLDPDPSSVLPDEMGGQFGMDSDEDEEPSDPITFAYDGRRFSVTMPREGTEADEEEVLYDTGRDPKKDEPEDEGGSNGPSADDFQQMAFVLRDMRFALAVELPKPVASSDATHLSGQTLTLYDMDFNTMFDDPDAFESIQDLDLGDGPQDLTSGGMGSMANVPGMTVETAETVTVTFR
ncbi:MAG: hypothetical protein AAF791_06480 [Bacteroidota bacterium]